MDGSARTRSPTEPERPQGAEVLAVVVNWNGWRDTLACVQSLRAVAAATFTVVICDNASSDSSIEHVIESLRSAAPAVEASVQWDEGQQVIKLMGLDPVAGATLKDVYLLPFTTNLGYAGAINRCIIWGRRRLQVGGYWLLNNDIKVAPDALAHLMAATQLYPEVGLCGSVLLEWDDPARVQAIGGMFNHCLAVGRHVKTVARGIDSPESVLFHIDYPVGASLFVTERFLEKVGLMDDGYFLYYEEMDWCERGRAKGFKPAVALRSRVRHKEGASTGSGGGVRGKSMLSEYYGVINRLRYTRKFSPRLVPLVWLSLLLVVAERVIHGEWARAALVLRLMLNPRSVARP
jgi:GT2 family glycosyltransferase